jgi:hypothetical protein
MLGALLAAPISHAEESTDRASDAALVRVDSQRELTPAIRHSIGRGLRFLLRAQQSTESFNGDTYPVAVNALVGLALLTGGCTESEGERIEHVAALRQCTSRILAYQTPSGYVDGGSDRGMYGHGFATLFLAELYGQAGERDEKVGEALKRAVRAIEALQHVDGGWDYNPREITGSDISITVCQTMALRAARNLGISVNGAVVDRARAYIEKSQLSDGGFRYRTDNSIPGMTGSAFPRSAAGVCILYSLGDYSSTRIRSGIDYLEANYRKDSEFPFYGHYYCSQAMFQVGGTKWRTYYEWISQRLLRDQREDGAWRSRLLQLEKNEYQTTAMALIILQLPYRLLPIHER